LIIQGTSEKVTIGKNADEGDLIFFSIFFGG
jgi:hypothetical protein